MALIVEDGSIVANANSYVTDDEYVNYAVARGLQTGLDAYAREKELMLAMDYIEGRNFIGHKVDPDVQSLQFPRWGIYIDNHLRSSDTIPKELKYAQIEAAIASREHALLVNQTVENVQRKKLDKLEINYFANGSQAKINLGRVNNYLKYLVRQGINAVRV